MTTLNMEFHIKHIMKKKFFDALHELINWMRDHEQGITYWDDVVSGNLFPEFENVEKVMW